MRVLHIDTGEEMRGGQHQVLLLMRGLRKSGHESVLLAHKHSPLRQAAESDGFTVYDAEAKELWRRSKEVALVHAHDARAHTIAAMTSRRKFVVSRRVAFPVQRSVASVWKYQRPARFLAVSQFVARELTAAGVREERIDVVYDGVDASVTTAEWRSEYPAIALASRDPQKGRDLISEAAAVASVPVVFSDDLRRDLQRASMFVYATRSEGLGSAALLAMSVGVPVIASRVSGLVELFDENVSGFLVENKPGDIAAAMRKVLDQPKLAMAVGQNGRKRVEENFTEEHLVSRTIASYERALNG